MTTAVAIPPAPLGPSAITIQSATPARSSLHSSSKSSSHSPPNMGESRLRKNSSEEKRSPNLSRTSSHNIPKVIVKKEPTSPEEISSSRRRPRHLDLSNNSNMSSAGPGALSGRPLTSIDGNFGMHDVLSACLSPGFNTSDPAVQQQLQRSMSVRDQQRLIIEARQKGQKPPGEQDTPKNSSEALFKPNRNTSRRKGPPPMLSIAPPSHPQFANERVIQSAPLNASFTGLRHNPDGSIVRPAAGQPSNLSRASHIHHAPAIQTTNRLPPIADVFPGELQSNGQMRNNYNGANLSPGHHANQAPLPSPGYPPSFQQAHQAQAQSGAQQPSQPPPPSRNRSFQSADEAVRSLTGGREELLPRLVHYGGHQPPTPPSPAPHKTLGLGVSNSGSSSAEHPSHPVNHRHSIAALPTGSRRRNRDEYEKDTGSPPLGRGPVRRAPNGPSPGGLRDSPETVAAKKEKFMRLVEEAWDLFHS